MTRLRQIAVCHAEAERPYREEPFRHPLLAFSFRQGPTFRMGFDAHVKAWDRHNRTRVLAEYLNNPRFAEAHDTEVARLRKTPMPEWARKMKEARHARS